MLSPTESAELRQVLEADLARLVGNAQAAIGFTMDRDRDRIGRDSIDEAMEEELYSTQLRIHDRENFLIPKIQEAHQAPRRRRDRRVRGVQRADRLQTPDGPPGDHAVLRVQEAREQVESDDAARVSHPGWPGRAGFHDVTPPTPSLLAVENL
jgi:hypothetical protein